MSETPKKLWSCKVGFADAHQLPAGSDWPMREAVIGAFRQITGCEPEFTFSGWGDKLTEAEDAALGSGERSRAAGKPKRPTRRGTPK